VADSPDPEPDDDGTEPDPRFTFANERTFLAWSRTALALVVAGLGIVQLLPPFPGVPVGRHLLGVPLIVFGAIVAVTAYIEWARSQRAMRHGQPLPRSVMPLIMAVVVAIMAVVSAVVVLISALRLWPLPATRALPNPAWPGSEPRWPGPGPRSPSPPLAAWC
jgi:putative membrane protein